MRILVGCERSGIVRDAFISKGHDAWSCDIVDSLRPGPHITDNVLNWLNGWDMLICFPPCTHLASSGARWFSDKKDIQLEALDFVNKLLNAPIEKICLENPVGVISTYIRKPTQIIQPWMFGHRDSKKTCLWLKNLPRLKPTQIMDSADSTCHYLSQSKHRSFIRSKTYPGIAQAMAEQWG